MTARQPHMDADAPPGAGLYLTKSEMQDLYESMLLAGQIGRPVVRKLERGLIRCEGGAKMMAVEPFEAMPSARRWTRLPGKFYVGKP